MSKRCAVLLSLLLVLIFSAAVLIMRLPSGKDGVFIRTRSVEKESVLTGADGERDSLELLPGEKLNINTAAAEELMKLPGIGETLSRAIVEYRQENGDFSCIEDIMNVNGIGEGKFSAIEGNICVEG